MLLSVISGTFNRLSYLKQMIQSVRDQMPKHLGFEFVIVDGGSTDGSLEYLEQQSDVNLIAHGELRGAIKSFGEAARAATGQYVLFANDDVKMHDHSILRAISHLEENRTCGIVAFGDNRFAQTEQENPQRYRVMKIQATGINGEPTSANYGQICIIRSWLGNRVGFWGDLEPFMSKARTYGGDSYMSAAVLELGYSVDAVPGCTVDDFIPSDAMRTKNVSSGSRDSAQYYARFPRGPQLQAYPQVNNPDRERLRVLLADIHEPSLPARTAKERGLAEALAEVGLVYHVDQINDEYDLVAITHAWQPHLIVIQLHDTDRIDANLLREIRAEKPDAVITSWNGDAAERGLISEDILAALHECDLQTVVNAKVLPVYKRKGINAAYWQIGYKPAAQPYQGDVPHHTILFQGNVYNAERQALVQALRETGLDVGFYGNIPNANGWSHYDFSLQEALNRAATIVVGDTFKDTVGFVSNRLFQVLGAGGFLLQEHSPKLDKYTWLKAGKHYAEWTDLADLKAKIAEWVRPEMADKRREIADAGCAYVQEHFSYPAQIKKLWELLPA